MNRRDFLLSTGAAFAASNLMAQNSMAQDDLPKGNFNISVAAWSWHRMMFSGEASQLDQPRLAREAGAAGLELVNQFFPSPMDRYVKDLDQRAKDEGIKILLIMCDGEGSLYTPDFRERRRAIVNHRKWLDIAAHLGCHSIRTNAGHGNVPAEDAMNYAADSFYELALYARQYGMNVIIENHGGLSSDPEWLSGLIEKVGEDNFGTLPDFGNFPRENGEYAIDIYAAVDTLMPYAKAVSAKSYDFNDEGWHIGINYKRMMSVVLSHAYNGYIGVEYEGRRLSEKEGVQATVNLLKRFQA